MKNFKEIVLEFDVVEDVKVKGKKVVVAGLINSKSETREYIYKHSQVAKAVSLKVSYLANIK